MVDNSIGVIVDGSQAMAQIAALEAKFNQLASSIGGRRIASPRVEAPNLANFFNACDQAEKRVIKVKSQIEVPNTIGGGFTSFLNAEKGKFSNVG